MKKILIHAHVFYSDMWEQVASCISNIHEDSDIYVTLVGQNEELREKILAHFPDAHIVIVDNVGFDVAPFARILDAVDLEDYSYIVKVHTKRDVKADERILGVELGGSRWREKLLSFISSREAFVEALTLMEKKSDVGMVADDDVVFGSYLTDHKTYYDISEFLKKQGWKPCRYAYVAGTMFIARASCFRAFKGLLQSMDFGTSANRSPQLAHVLERLFGYTVYASGMRIASTTPISRRLMKASTYQKAFRSLLHYVFRKEATADGRLTVRLMGVPIYRRVCG